MQKTSLERVESGPCGDVGPAVKTCGDHHSVGRQRTFCGFDPPAAAVAIHALDGGPKAAPESMAGRVALEVADPCLTRRVFAKPPANAVVGQPRDPSERVEAQTFVSLPPRSA